MKCALCKTRVCKKGTTTITLTRGEAIVVLKYVPALVCDQCGHYFLTQTTTRNVLKRGNEAVKKGTELEIINLKAT